MNREEVLKENLVDVSMSSRIIAKIQSAKSLYSSNLSVRKFGSIAESGADPVSVTTPYAVPGERISSSGMRVNYARKIKRIQLERYLVSKIVFKLEEVTFTDILVLYDNLLWCQDKSLMDPSFQKKFGGFLEKLTVLLKETRFHEKTFSKTLQNFSVKLKEVSEGHLIPERNLSSSFKHLKGLFHCTPTKSTGVPVKQLPPVKVIGRGYRDKGNAKDLAFDASPSWQEVAQHFSELERRNDPKE